MDVVRVCRIGCTVVDYASSQTVIIGDHLSLVFILYIHRYIRVIYIL